MLSMKSTPPNQLMCMFLQASMESAVSVENGVSTEVTKKKKKKKVL